MWGGPNVFVVSACVDSIMSNQTLFYTFMHRSKGESFGAFLFGVKPYLYYYVLRKTELPNIWHLIFGFRTFVLTNIVILVNHGEFGGQLEHSRTASLISSYVYSVFWCCSAHLVRIRSRVYMWYIWMRDHQHTSGIVKWIRSWDEVKTFYICVYVYIYTYYRFGDNDKEDRYDQFNVKSNAANFEYFETCEIWLNWIVFG